MRFLGPCLLWAILAVHAGALGRLVQPDGSVVALGESTSGAATTILFPSQSWPERTWLLLPEGLEGGTGELVWQGGRWRFRLPTVKAPGLRYALEAPGNVLSLSLTGGLATDPVFTRTEALPEGPLALAAVARDRVLVDLPPWRVAPGYVSMVAIDQSSAAPWTVTVGDGANHHGFALPAGYPHWTYAPRAWSLEPRRIEVRGANLSVTSVRVEAFGPQADLPADPPTLLAWPTEAWRQPSHEWFSWTGTRVLVLVTSDYDVQDAYLKRLAFFVEKTGYRGRLWSDEALAHAHGWNAHDYPAEALAAFFTLAAQQDFALNDAEKELRDRLVAFGVLEPQGAGWRPGQGALVGISAQSPPALRSALFVHEGFHGLYFTSTEFQVGVRTLWMGLSDSARQVFRRFLALSQYDPSDEALMVNEFQAYVLQRSAAEWNEFFRDRVKAGRWLPEFLGAARGLDALVGHLYGLKSGTITSVRRF